MSFKSTDQSLADQLDREDELASFRDEFVIHDPNLIYLDGNSLGRLPRQTVPFLNQVISDQWGNRLIRGWEEHWIDLPRTIGAKLAPLIGAHPDQVLVTEATSINLFKLATAALRARPDRTRIVSDVLNFPSDLYILQGIIDLLGNRHQLECVPSVDKVTIDPDSLSAAIDENTALVCLTHVAFKSAYMHVMARVTEMAHKAGALVLWDLSHSAGAVPLDLDGCNVDLAVGCTYKYLNGGPGAPAFLYVRRDLESELSQPMWGWFASHNPFAFSLDFEPDPGISRFRVGTPHILSTRAIEPGLDMLLKAGMDRIRAKSVKLGEYLIYLADQWLIPLGFELGSPRSSARRGSHVSLRHPDAAAITRELVEPKGSNIRVIPDFRESDNIRLGLAPLYNTFTEVHLALARMREIARD